MSAFAHQSLPQHELSGHAREVYEWVVSKYIIPRFGGQAVSACDTKAISAWLRDLESEGKKSPLMAKVKTVASALSRPRRRRALFFSAAFGASG